VRRKPGNLAGIEPSIIVAAADLAGRSVREFHGYQLAKDLVDLGGTRRLISHGTLYRALDRLEASGLIESRWEDPHEAAAAGRPRRRLYRLTSRGSETAHSLLVQRPRPVPSARQLLQEGIGE
jgi:DNA-binding PadR family transcriptional regulator